MSVDFKQAFTVQRNEVGFTLIELMVSMLIALIILAGLYTSFSTQNTEYSYQNKRVDAVQDMEFAIKFIADDLRASLVTGGLSSVAITNDAAGRTTDLRFWVWDAQQPDADANTRARRRYVFDNANNRLCYDRQTAAPGIEDIPLAGPCGLGNEILPSITYFKVFVDGVTPRIVPVGNPSAGNPYPRIPTAMPTTSLLDSTATPVPNVSGYTILLEFAVQAGYNQGLMQDVLGNPTTNKRVWRYIQVYPQPAVN